jgi:hypothetical protein
MCGAPMRVGGDVTPPSRAELGGVTGHSLCGQLRRRDYLLCWDGEFQLRDMDRDRKTAFSGGGGVGEGGFRLIPKHL